MLLGLVIKLFLFGYLVSLNYAPFFPIKLGLKSPYIPGLILG